MNLAPVSFSTITCPPWRHFSARAGASSPTTPNTAATSTATASPIAVPSTSRFDGETGSFASAETSAETSRLRRNW
jgi:hypothetical protein